MLETDKKLTKKYSYSTEREIRTYEYLRMSSADSLKKAKEIKEGSFYQVMSSLVFSAFTIEAYLNHVGSRKISYWSEIERIEPLSKLKIVYSHLNLTFDSSRRPVQTVKQLFKFRNFMAHGKTENLKASGVLKKSKPDPNENLVEVEWQKFCNEKEAERAVADISELIKTICDAAGFDRHELNSLGHESYVIKDHDS